MYILIDLVIYINSKQKFQSGTLIEFGKQLWRQNIVLCILKLLTIIKNRHLKLLMVTLGPKVEAQK